MATAQCSEMMSRGTTMRMTMTAVGVIILTVVILPCFDSFSAEDMVYVRSAVWARINPRLDGLEHGPMSFIMHIPKRRVMEDLETIIHDLLFGHRRMVPSIEDPRSDIPQNSGSDVASGFVEDIREMIL